jgi:hypothetical protein
LHDVQIGLDVGTILEAAGVGEPEGPAQNQPAAESVERHAIAPVKTKPVVTGDRRNGMAVPFLNASLVSWPPSVARVFRVYVERPAAADGRGPDRPFAPGPQLR